MARMTVIGLLATCVAAATDTIIFERHFPGAVPERFEVRLAQDGSATYAEADGEVLELSLGESAVGPLFEQAESLGFFTEPLASNRRVASTGKKTLRYESGGQVRGEVRFDYSESREARELTSWFVRLAETQQHLRELERTYRFDRLGVNKAVVSLQEAYERERIAVPGLLVPILTKIAGQDRIVHVARARAEGLLERIRASER